MAKSLKSGMIKVLMANVLTLMFSLLTNFILPKYLSVESYSEIKTFQLYITYIGVLHFGYEDGMYLKYGGKTINEISGDDLQTNLYTLRIFQIIVTAVTVVIAAFLKDAVFLAFALAILPVNLVAYFKLLFQAIGEFGKYGRIMNVTAIITFIINVIALFVIRTDNYRVFLFGYVAWDLILWILLEIYLKNKLPSRKTPKYFSFGELKKNISTGFPLTLGNFSSVMLTSIDRWFVKGLMSTLDFAQYSFAVSTESFINVALTPITVTFYNYFCKNTDIKEILKMRNCVLIFASYVVSCAFGAKFIMRFFLDKYMEACDVMFILFSAQICYVVIKGIYVNIYKAQKRQNEYFRRLVLVVIIGIVLNALFYVIKPCKETFAFGTLASALIWLILCLRDFPELKIRMNEALYLGASISAFIVLGFFMESIIGFILYIVTITLFARILLYDDLKYLINMALGTLKLRRR